MGAGQQGPSGRTEREPVVDVDEQREDDGQHGDADGEERVVAGAVRRGERVPVDDRHDAFDPAGPRVTPYGGGAQVRCG
jgi:hypothetical protein